MDAYLAKQLLERIAKLEQEIQTLRLALHGAGNTTSGQNWNYTQNFPNYTTI